MPFFLLLPNMHPTLTINYTSFVTLSDQDSFTPNFTTTKALVKDMVSLDIARTAVGILGNVISLFLFLSPTPTFVGICKKGSVEQFSPAPYLATLMNCMMLVLYGLPMVHPNSTLVITINGAGTVIELIFIVLFLIYSDTKKRVKILAAVILELIFISILGTLVLTTVHTYQRRSMIVGIFSIMFNTMMYASPLSILKLVIKTKSVEYMPFFLSIASFGNALCWTAYALIRFDIFIVLPNGLGTLFGLAQLILYATFYKSTKKQTAMKEFKGDLSLSEMGFSGDCKKSNING